MKIYRIYCSWFPIICIPDLTPMCLEINSLPCKPVWAMGGNLLAPHDKIQSNSQGYDVITKRLLMHLEASKFKAFKPGGAGQIVSHSVIHQSSRSSLV